MFSKKQKQQPKLTESTLTINVLDINPGDMFKFENKPWQIIKGEDGEIRLRYYKKSSKDSMGYIAEDDLIGLLELLATVIHSRSKQEKK